MIKVYFEERQQDVWKFHWLDPPRGGLGGGGSPPKVSTPFLPGKTEVKWTEAIQKVATILLKIAERLAYG